MNARTESVVTPSFLGEVASWTIWLSVGIGVGAIVFAHDTGFALACLLAASVDVFLVRVALAGVDGPPITGEGRPVVGMLVVGRLAAKIGLLLVSVSLPHVLDFTGTAVGVLVFDLTLAMVGSLVASLRVFSILKRGGERHV